MVVQGRSIETGFVFSHLVSSVDSEDRRSSVETLSAMWPKLDSAKRQGHQLDIKLAFSPTHSFGFLVGIEFYY